MPLFTFVCPVCKAVSEVICKASERDTYEEPCPNARCGGVKNRKGRAPMWMRWQGVEGSQATRLQGKYQFALKDSRGGVVMKHKPERGF